MKNKLTKKEIEDKIECYDKIIAEYPEAVDKYINNVEIMLLIFTIILLSLVFI